MPPDLAAAAKALRAVSVEDLLLPVLVQLAVVVAAARVFGVLARRVGQPTVVGEVVAGLLLGPSAFGALFPELAAAVFRPTLDGVPQPLTDAAFPKIFAVLSQLGLILLLFLIGLEFEFGHLKARGKAAVGISLAGTAIPFALGAGLALVVHPYLEPHPEKGPIDRFGLTLFMGVAMAITAIPVLGRMMLEMGITRTKLGAVVITAAAVGDAVGWVLLATVAALAAARFDPADTLLMAALTVAFGLLMAVAVRPVLAAYFRRSMAANGGKLTLNALAVLLVAVLLAALATNRIGIFAVFGPFLLGAVLSDQHALRDAVAARLRDFVTAFFLPVYFTYTGLRTEVGSLAGGTMWLICLAVIGTAVVGKFGGCGLAARAAGYPRREAALIGALMNTRGLMELVVVNVGYEAGVIPKSLYCMLVLMAVATTAMTTPLVLLFRRGTEIEGPMEASGFVRATSRSRDAESAERSAATPESEAKA